jgi:hypothetical protein
MVVPHKSKQHRPSDTGFELDIPQEQHTIILIFRCGPDSSSASSSNSSLTLSLYSHACTLPLYSKSESAVVNGKKSYAGRCFTTALPSSSTSRVSLPLPFSISQLLPTDHLSPLLFSVSHMLSGAPLFPSYSSPTSRTRSSSLDLADGCRISFPQPPLSSHGEPAQISGFKSSS